MPAAWPSATSGLHGYSWRLQIARQARDCRARRGPEIIELLDVVNDDELVRLVSDRPRVPAAIAQRTQNDRLL
ncbi:MAG: hypothetical protein AAEI08_03725 [Gammaproteobacteria bacterium]